ncbi:MAG: hypothetical protein HY586_03620 [Candidatus Omnitrophica bacterium]|nr:hypothetical protein [Candidatus Omnitrophota bacterium]
MKFLKLKNNQKGFVMVTTYLLSAAIVVLAGASYIKAIYDSRYISREYDRIQTHYAAEAGLQSALAQVGTNAYTGFINTAALNIANFRSAGGINVGSVAVTMTYPNQADWVIVNAAATVNGVTRNLEGRIFLESNFSKYMTYMEIPNLAVGNRAKFGYHDGNNPEGVSSNDKERMAMYYTGNWIAMGNDIEVFGDLHVEGAVQGLGQTAIHGDTYAGDFTLDANGAVANDGVSGQATIQDGFSDDSDRNGDGTIDAKDAPDRHDLTLGGEGDSHQTEELTKLYGYFYKKNSSLSAFQSEPSDKYLEFQENGDHTRIVQYNDYYKKPINTYELPPDAVIYLAGDVHVRGQVKGRVTVYSEDDVFIAGDVTYAGNVPHSADPGHSLALLARNRIFLLPDDVTVVGILRAENYSGAIPLDASRGSNYRPDYSKTKLRTYGNLIITGQPNTSIYGDRIFGYDPGLQSFRPPGIPVQPELRMVRET